MNSEMMQLAYRPNTLDCSICQCWTHSTKTAWNKAIYLLCHACCIPCRFKAPQYPSQQSMLSMWTLLLLLVALGPDFRKILWQSYQKPMKKS